MTKSAIQTAVFALWFLFSAYSYADNLQFSSSVFSVSEAGLESSAFAVPPIAEDDPTPPAGSPQVSAPACRW